MSIIFNRNYERFPKNLLISKSNQGNPTTTLYWVRIVNKTRTKIRFDYSFFALFMTTITSFLSLIILRCAIADIILDVEHLSQSQMHHALFIQ